MKTNKKIIAVLLALCMLASAVSMNMVAKASATVDMDTVEMNKTIPTLRGTNALAYVDFDSTNGTSSKWTNQYYDLAVDGDNKLTLSEMQGLADSYTIVFRAKLNSVSARDRALFAVFPNGTTPPSGLEDAKWCESLAVGMLGGTDSGNGNNYHAMYYEVRQASSTTDAETGETTYTMNGLIPNGNTYNVTRAADVSGDGDWHTIAIAQTGSGFNYYVDGELLDFIATDAIDTTYGFANIGEVFKSYTDTDFHAWIGKFYASHGGVVNAKFDWFAFYGSALTTAQVEELSDPYAPMVKYYDDISGYRSSENGYTYEAKDGYTFAGWYSDADCEVPLSEKEANSATGAYAKYVSDDILCVKGQFSKEYTYTDSAGEEKIGRSMKFITSVDSLVYSEVGFKLIQHSSKGDKEAKVSSNSVCTKLYAVDSNSETLKYTPQGVFCEKSTYFKTYTLTEVPNYAYGVEITAIPYWVTLDGTTVYGAQATKTINEGILADKIKSNSSLKASTATKLFSIDQPWAKDSSIDIDTYSYAPQGGYTDGTYYYQAYIEMVDKTSTDNRVRICQYDMSGNLLINKLVTPSDIGYSLDHANDITYNSKEGCFLVVHAAPTYTKVSYFKLNTETMDLEYVKTEEVDYNIISIDYHEDKDQYVVGLKYTQAFRILDADFNPITPELAPTSTTSSSTTQGVACDDNYVYFVLYNPNVIAVYNWDGTFVTVIDLDDVISNEGTISISSYTLGNYEPENISVIGNKIYLGCTYNDDTNKLTWLSGYDGIDTFEVYVIDSSELVAN